MKKVCYEIAVNGRFFLKYKATNEVTYLKLASMILSHIIFCLVRFHNESKFLRR